MATFTVFTASGGAGGAAGGATSGGAAGRKQPPNTTSATINVDETAINRCLFFTELLSFEIIYSNVCGNFLI